MDFEVQEGSRSPFTITGRPGGVNRRVPGRNCDQANQNSGIRINGFSRIPFSGPFTRDTRIARQLVQDLDAR
jgi:hypothetical protein